MTTNDSELLPEFERPCPSCGGAGRWRGMDQWHPCQECDGLGMLPTDLGQRVLELVRRNVRVRELAANE